MKTYVLLATFLFCSFNSIKAQRDVQPNVLFIIADDLGKYLPMYGDVQSYAPTIESIGAEGVIFERAYSNFPVCGPSRASMLTGLYPETVYKAAGVGYKNNDMKNYSVAKSVLNTVNPNAKTLLEYIKTEGGYYVVGGGKLYHSAEASKTPDFSNMINTSSLPAYSKNKNNKVLVEDNHYFNDAEHRDGYLANNLVQRIEDYATKTIGGNKPLFIAMGLQKPHGPYAAPTDYFRDFPISKSGIEPTTFFDQPNDVYESYTFSPVENILKNYNDVALNSSNYVDVSKGQRFSNLKPELQRKITHAYYTCISFIDTQIKKVVDVLKEKGLYDNTIIVITSDHGYKLGHYDRLGKYSVHETDTAVPLIISGPGIESGKRTTSVVQLIDIYPTLCQATSTAIPSWCEGTSLTPVLSDTSKKVNKYAYTVVNKGGNWIGKSIIEDEGIRYSKYVSKNDGMFLDPPGKVLSQEIYDYSDGNIYTAYNKVNNASYDTYLTDLSLAIDGFFSSGNYAKIPEGKNYYVSASGDDSNDGLSEATPWKTLEKVSDADIQPGDSVFFKRGDTFIGQLKPSYSGTDIQPITFSAYGLAPEKPILSGSGGAGGDYVATIFINNQEYFNIANLEIQNNRAVSRIGERDDECFGIFVWNNGTEVMHHFKFSNLTVQNVFPITDPSDEANFNKLKMAGIYLRSERNTVAGQEKHIRDVTLTDSFFTRIAKFGFWSQHAGGDAGIGSESLNRNMNYVLKNNRFLHTGGSGITPGGTYNLLVENNVFDYPGSSIDRRMVGRGSGAWFFNCRNVIAQYNKSYHARGNNDSYGMHIDFGNKYVILQYNYSEDNQGFVEILGKNLHATYRFNVSVNDGRRQTKGNTFWFSDYAGAKGINSDSLWVYNNTVFVDKMPDGDFLKPGLQLKSNDALIANNSIYVKPGAHVGYKQFNRGNLVQVDHNLYFGDVREDNFANQDANAKYANPLYVNPGALNNADAYKLEVDSPAIESGRAIIEPPFPMAGTGIFTNITAKATKDYFGNPVDLTIPGTNIGAYNGSGEVPQGNNALPTGPIYEAEHASLTGGLETTICDAFSGKIAVKKLIDGQSLTFNLYAPEAGNYDVKVDYLTTSDSAMTYSLNGDESQSVNVISTGSFCYEDGKTGKITLSLMLNEGFNTLKFSEAPIIDRIEVVNTISGGVFEAENAILSGTAGVVSCDNASGNKMVKRLNNGSSNALTFKNILAATTNTFNLIVSYYAKSNTSLTYKINSNDPITIPIIASGEWCFKGGSPASHTIQIVLPLGYNNIKFYDSPILDKIELISRGNTWEAEKATLLGTARVNNCAQSSEKKSVKGISGGSENAVEFDAIHVSNTGTYNLVLSYMSAKAANMDVEINGIKQKINLVSSGEWCFRGGSPTDHAMSINLNEGLNNVKIYNAPQLDKISVRPIAVDSHRSSISFNDGTYVGMSSREVLIYPNYVSQGQNTNAQIMGHFSNTDNVAVSIFDISGKRVLGSTHRGVTDFELATSSLSKGLYILKFNMKGRTLIKRFIVR